MGLYDEFRFRPASWLPHSELPLEELERVRNIRREDMEYTNENGYSVRVVLDPTLCMVQDMFYRIVKSDLEDKPFSMICPNQWPAAYSAVAEMINKFNINCRNLHAFAMDEWADENGNVAPLTVCENSLFGPMGASGDVWAVPPKSATIGPRDVMHAKEVVELHNFANADGSSWQRMVSRLELYGPISMECPASIYRLKKGVCYVSEAIAKPFGSWYNGIADKDI